MHWTGTMLCTLLLTASLVPVCAAQTLGRTQTTQQPTNNNQQSSQEPTVVVLPPPMIDNNCSPFQSSTPGESELRAQMLDKLGPQVPPL